MFSGMSSISCSISQRKGQNPHVNNTADCIHIQNDTLKASISLTIQFAFSA